MPPARILFFADSGPQIGGGHVMRCLTLAGALAERGAQCAFVAPPAVQAVLATFGSGEAQAIAVSEADPEAMVEQTRRAAEAWAPDWLVIDHYRLQRAHESVLRAEGRRLMVLDDLADRQRDCDLLLNPGYGQTTDDYAGLTPPGATVLAGTQFALVRPQFAALREAALAQRGPVRRVLVSLGLTDFGGITERVVRGVLPVLGEVQLDVVLGSGAASLTPLTAFADPRVTLHVDATDMAALTARADLAIGAGGSSVWERACLGLPGVTLILADNQRELAERLDADGLTVAVDASTDFEASLVAALQALADDEARRGAMSERLSALCDGSGAGRVASHLL